MAVHQTFLICSVLSFRAVHCQESTFDEILNNYYSNGTGLIVSLMHHAFENDSLAPGVPVWACPSGDDNCTWHDGKWYASATWISWDLYGELGVELYHCNPSSCKNANLMLVYNPLTTVVGSAYIADADTDIDTIDGKAMEGCSTTFSPPACSQVHQICSTIDDPDWMASCLKQAGGDVGKPYKDSFSQIYGGVREGTLLSYDSNDTPSNFSRFVAMQKRSFELFPNVTAFKGACPDGDTSPNCTCNAGGFGYNELPIRTANPQTVCPNNSCSTTEYQDLYCKNQIPIALAYVAGDEDEPLDSHGKLRFYNHYVKQIRDICNRTLPLVKFDPSNKNKQPFLPFTEFNV